jgi:cobalt-zinc-cadmium efflux system protein
VSILIGIIIVWSTWGLLKDSIFLALAGVPAGIDKDKVERYLVEHDEIERIHDVHIWALSTSQTAMTAHIVRSGSEFSDRFLYEVGEKLNEKFNIHR